MHAILLDGGFVCRRMLAKHGKFPKAEQVLDYCAGISGHSILRESDLLRIYFYDAPPAEGSMLRPVDGVEVHFSNSEVGKRSEALQWSLAESPGVALRLGELQRRGWKVGPRATRSLRKQNRYLNGPDFVPDFVQKGVDLRIGLDIARLALQKLVGEIVLVTGDSDFIPAMKFARREGVRVMLDTMGQPPRHERLAHSDFSFAGSE